MIDFAALNYLAIFVGGILYMAFGAFYFSPILFGKTWTRLTNAQFNIQKYIASALIAFISSFLIALLVQIAGIDTLLSGLGLGLMIGLLAAFVFLKNTLFGLTSTKIYAIAMGEHMISFMLLGMLHALWK